MKEQITTILDKHKTDCMKSYKIEEGKCFDYAAYKVTVEYKYKESIKNNEGMIIEVERAKTTECIIIEIQKPNEENKDVVNYENNTKFIYNYYDLNSFEKKLKRDKED